MSEPPAFGAVLGCVVPLEELPLPPHAAVYDGEQQGGPAEEQASSGAPAAYRLPRSFRMV